MSDDQKTYTNKTTIKVTAFECSVETSSNEPPPNCCCGKGGGISFDEKLRALLAGFLSQYAAFNADAKATPENTLYPDIEPDRP